MTPHLRGQVRAYVDRSLPLPALQLYDRHLVCCALCQAAADQERRIVASLRSDTNVPMSLRSSLIGLASSPPPMEATRQPTVPPMSLRMPSGASHAPVPTVRPTAPPQHRSPMRAAVVASIAAGASVAAAWGLTLSPLPTGGTPARVSVARLGDPAFGDPGFGVSTISGATAFPVARGSAASAPAARTGPSAQTVADLAGSTAAVAGAYAARGSMPGGYWVRHGAGVTVLVAAVGDGGPRGSALATDATDATPPLGELSPVSVPSGP